MMDAKQLAKHVAKKWEAITGLSRESMNDEGEFPEEVENLCSVHGVDLADFSEAFNAHLEGA